MVPAREAAFGYAGHFLSLRFDEFLAALESTICSLATVPLHSRRDDKLHRLAVTVAPDRFGWAYARRLQRLNDHAIPARSYPHTFLVVYRRER
jgi:hypothetical protein